MKNSNNLNRPPTLYGTKYLCSYNGTPLTEKYVNTLTIEQKAEVAQELFTFYRAHGFPYPDLSDEELLYEFNRLVEIDSSYILKDNNTLVITNYTGSNIIKNFSPHFFETKSGSKNRPSMVECFNNDKLLLKTIENRLEIGFNMTSNMLKQGLANSKLAFKTSIFNVILAKFIYDNFSKPGDLVYDYSMGFGHRMIAALSVKHSLNIIATDPWKETVASNQAIFDFFQNKITGFNKFADLNNEGSEEFCPEEYKGKVNLAFSSPPYFKTEIFDPKNPEKQAYNKSYELFINDYWKKTVLNIKELLAPDGKFLVNIAWKYEDYDLCDDMRKIAENEGFELKDIYYIQLSKNLAFRAKKRTEHKLEPILIFKKK